MPIPFKLDDVIERTLRGQGTSEQRELKRLAGVRLSASEARAVWRRILEHKWFLSERLGRDVGLRVAVTDYFENVASLPEERCPRVVGPTSLAAFELAMSGTRSLAR